ncbi:class I adenylate-forming enzyme family protein [Pelomonas sp. KK5]|uniref:class I adenylate-forming enzyme family protein n=1 Tax=Pelomonas sp. KK5 TaxID=1855730 RepID=UPI00097C6A1B|nr:class I adenylate-forming enzyme family protein [Pelomonas sp. KK5]
MNLANYCAYWANMRGDQPAAVFKGRTLTWAELDRQADAVAASLQQLGTAPGDRIGCLLDNGLEWVVTWAAVHKAGGILVPLNPRYGDVELGEIAKLVDCTALVSTATQAARLDKRFAVPAGSPQPVCIFPLRSAQAPLAFERAIATAARPTPTERGGDDVALITFTSGSTGRPKGAVLTHRAIDTMAFGMTLAFRYTSRDRMLLLAPFAFTGGLVCVYVPAYILGACIHIEDTLDAPRALATIERERITVMMGVPILWERMAASPGFAAADLGSLRTATTGGAPVSQALLKQYVDKGVGIVQTYGCTEAAGFIAIPSPAAGAAKPWACGGPVPSLQMRVVDEERQPCAAGDVGEIQLRGGQMFAGYWNDADASAEAWTPDRWYRTGDLGRLDEAGHVQITDRKKNMVISGGVNVYPAEVERTLGHLAGVDEVLAFGVPDAQWGERLVAVVHGGAALDLPALMAEARTALGAYKTPKEILRSPEPLPRTSTGKLLRAQLPALYERLTAPRTDSP